MSAAHFVLSMVAAVQPQADTLRYEVINHGRHAGTMNVVTLADTAVLDVHRWDQNTETTTTTRYVMDGAGTIVRLEAHRADGPAQPGWRLQMVPRLSTAELIPDQAERFSLVDGTATWRTPVVVVDRRSELLRLVVMEVPDFAPYLVSNGLPFRMTSGPVRGVVSRRATVSDRLASTSLSRERNAENAIRHSPRHPSHLLLHVVAAGGAEGEERR